MRTPPPFVSKRLTIISRLCLRSVAGLFLASAAWAQSSYTSPYAISTLAGSAGTSADGTGSAARFSNAGGIASDSSGTLYVADTANNTIRKVTSGGVVTTFAGTVGVVGSTDGTGAAAQFNSPTSVAVDGSGNVYVADALNSTIRKITPAGVVTTFAGTAGAFGSADGTGSAARFNIPAGVASDSAGNVYVADTNNFTIRKITSAGVVTTLAGTPGSLGRLNGTGPAAQFNTPFGLTVDGSGNVFVADTANSAIRKITPAGVVTTFAGNPGSIGSADGNGTTARFFNPNGVAVDGSGNIFVADTTNHTIRKITSSGDVTTLAGSIGSIGTSDGTGSNARFNTPYGVAVDGSGNIYVMDTGNTTVRKITSGGTVSTLAGSPAATSVDGTGSAARFRFPQNIAIDSSGVLYVADTANDTIRKITPGGVVTTLAGSAGSSGSADGTGVAARFNVPQGVAVDGSGNVYVTDTGNNTIRKITPGGAVTTLAGSVGSVGSANGTGAAALFNHPSGIVVDASGNIFVADTVNGTIRKITPANVVTTVAGTAQTLGGADGTGAAAQFNNPFGLAIDGSGNIYVADSRNNAVRIMTPAGAVTTLAGSATGFGSADGAPSVARFFNPVAVAVDGSGNVFVADLNNSTIRKVTSAGVVSTVAGSPLLFGYADGTGSAARFSNPSGIAIDSSGNLYIADLGNSTIRLGQAAGVGSPPPGGQTAHLVNLSIRSTAGTGSQTLIGGFVIGGSGTKSVLVRGDGPALVPFGVTGVLPDPVLTLFNATTSAQVASNSAWGGSATLSNAFAQVGAFGLSPGSNDAAILAPLGAGPYTAQITSTSGDSGVVLVEVYDADVGTSTSRFVNLSARSQAGTGSQTLIAGFAVSGTGYETVLIRGDGPGLTQFGVTGALAAPQLTLYDILGRVVAVNTGWGNVPNSGNSLIPVTINKASAATFTQVGAFQLTANSLDCALVATLPPGTYTAQITGLLKTTGVALIEIYEVPAP